MGWRIALVTLVLAIIALSIMIWVVRHRSPAEATETLTPRLYKIRFRYFIILFAVLLALLGVTFSFLPYSQTQKIPAVIKMSAVGRMWFWQINPTSDPEHLVQKNQDGFWVLPTHTEIAFDVTSVDVNHGFGIYDESGNLLAQVQAMPGYTNTLLYQFDKPGTYSVLCMEYCGAMHHAMITHFVVQ